MIAGRKSRERVCMVLAQESFVLACFLQCLDLVTNASDDDPCADPESFVRGDPTLQL